ncbi:MAG: RNA-binding transcriptional accessory protein [Clostridia bacterium]|nr:RNA-binding transcriptional accessory protein [Clostridia bacterium]
MDKITQDLCAEFKMKPEHAENIVKLLDDGNTIPFIARYRKEMTGATDDQTLRKFADKLEAARALDERRADVARLIEEQGKLTGEIEKAIAGAKSLTELEDIYRPFRPKRRTRATIAREKGLEPLANIILLQSAKTDVLKEAARYIDEEKGVANAEEALSGARDIIAEIISDDAENRKAVRAKTYAEAFVSTKMKKENKTYEMYYDFSEPVNKIANHRILAMNRGEKEGVLTVKLNCDESVMCELLNGRIVSENGGESAKIVREAAEDSYSRLIAPSVETEIRNLLTERAEEKAIDLFAVNLKNLLMQPPVKNRVVLGVDPGYRTGCKLAVVDGTGKVLETSVGYFTLPHHDKEKAKKQMTDMIERNNVDVISIGNGTATGESEEFVSDVISQFGGRVKYMVVSEAGASVYSASKLAAEEFPQFDVSLRSAVSIARRLQDPLAELVKIEPKAIGVGQYQHDCNQKKLESALDGVVEECVNRVGVDLNTASGALLEHIAGVSGAVAKNIVKYREENGAFKRRRELLKVSKLGEKTFLQCAGFMRISDGEEVLDNTNVHPESYGAAKEILAKCGYTKEDVKKGKLIGFREKVKTVNLDDVKEKYNIGQMSIDDIVTTLLKPGRDERDELPKPLLRTGAMSIENLKEGMIVEGCVRNVIDFGAFIDIGVHQDALCHISKICDRYIKHPTEALSVGDVVKVKIIGVDVEKKRISVSMRDV